MSEAWKLRTDAGEACGPGTREALSLSAGSAGIEKSLATENTWNRLESRSFEVGSWDSKLDITTGAGGGPPNKVRFIIERRNSSCVVQQEIVNQERTLTKGTTCKAYSLGEHGVAQVDFNAGDILTVRIVQTNGNQATEICYNDVIGGDHDSRQINPNPIIIIDVPSIGAGHFARIIQKNQLFGPKS